VSSPDPSRLARFLDDHWSSPSVLIRSARDLHEPEGADPQHLDQAARSARGLASDALELGIEPLHDLASALADLASVLGSGALDPLGPGGVVLESGARTLEDSLVLLEAGGQPDAAEIERHTQKATHVTAGARQQREPQPAQPQPARPQPSAPQRWGPWNPAYPDMEDDFIEDVQSHIDNLQAGLIQLSSGTTDEELINDLFRSSHSIKGQSGQMGAQPLERMAHKLEDILDLVRQSRLTVTPAATESLLGVIDALQSILEQLRSTRYVDHPIEREMEIMDRVVRGEPAAVSRPEPVPAPPRETVQPPTPSPGPERPAARKDEHPARTSAEKKAQYLRVDFSKVDQVMNLVGDLFINKIKLHQGVDALDGLQLQVIRLQHLLAQQGEGAAEGVNLDEEEARKLLSGISELSSDIEGLADRLTAATGEADMISSDLHDQIMIMRMVPMDSILGRLGRVVFDAVQKESRGRPGFKRARLDVEGSDAEIDKVIAGMLEVPLVHIVRNAVAHGIEPAEDRAAADKPPEGRVLIKAGQKGGNFVIDVSDDGRGILPDQVARAALEKGIVAEEEIEGMSEKEILSLIFKPGFTTAATADDLKGRGVGLDEVVSKISAIKGSINVDSEPGRGTHVTLSLPLTLAINTVLVSEVGGETLAIPMAAVERVVSVEESEVERMGSTEVFTLLEKTVPLVRADDMLALDRPRSQRPDEIYVVVMQVGERRFGLAMDRMHGKQDVVVKSLGTLLGEVPLVAGATLLGEKCILILDPVDIAARIGKGAAPRRKTTKPPHERIRPRLLLVDDETTARIGLRRIFEEAGLEVVEASDGAEALEMASASHFQMVSTDVVMPRMDGYELTRRLRQMDQYRNVPIIMISSKGEDVDKRAGFDAGVDHYVVKPVERSALLELIGEVRL